MKIKQWPIWKRSLDKIYNKQEEKIIAVDEKWRPKEIYMPRGVF